MKEHAEMTKSAPMQSKVKKSGNTMATGSNAESGGKGGGAGGKFKKKHGTNSPGNAENSIGMEY